jgi:hypothetical protein
VAGLLRAEVVADGRLTDAAGLLEGADATDPEKVRGRGVPTAGLQAPDLSSSISYPDDWTSCDQLILYLRVSLDNGSTRGLGEGPEGPNDRFPTKTAPE